MKSTIISMLILLIVLTVVPLIFFGDNDLMEEFGFGGGGGGESIASLRAKAPKNISAVSTDVEVKMYKWVDENGVMQFTQTPPPQGAEQMTLSPNLNTMEATQVPPKETTASSGGNFKPVGNPYSPSGAKELMNQANDIRNMMNQRAEQQEKMLKR